MSWCKDTAFSITSKKNNTFFCFILLTKSNQNTYETTILTLTAIKKTQLFISDIFKNKIFYLF